MKTMGGSLSAMLLLAPVLFDPAPTAGASCESLTALKLPDTTITMAQPVAAGEFHPARGDWQFSAASAIQESSRFLPGGGHVKTDIGRRYQDRSLDAGFRMERQFQGVGNGGWSGAIVYPSLARALARGYATSSTDTAARAG